MRAAEADALKNAGERAAGLRSAAAVVDELQRARQANEDLRVKIAEAHVASSNARAALAAERASAERAEKAASIAADAGAAREKQLAAALEEERATRLAAEARAAELRVDEEMSAGRSSKEVAALKHRLLALQRENVALKRAACSGGVQSARQR